MNNAKLDKLSVEAETVKDCPILFNMYDKPSSQTCMCWGWEFGRGWDENVQSTCRQLEFLNQEFYPKYRVRIQADQIKEKYGTLHFYFSIVADPGRIAKWFIDKLTYFSRYLTFRFDYKMDKKCVRPEEHKVSKTEISKEEYIEKRKLDKKAYVKEKGKYYQVFEITYPAKYKFFPTKNKFLYKLNLILCDIIYSDFLYKDKWYSSFKTKNAIEMLEAKANQIINECEQKCAETCEECGNQIGTSWSPTCMTEGYVRYLCEKCAKKLDLEYKVFPLKIEENEKKKPKKTSEKSTKQKKNAKNKPKAT